MWSRINTFFSLVEKHFFLPFYVLFPVLLKISFTGVNFCPKSAVICSESRKWFY
jgi:hypothetical protein